MGKINVTKSSLPPFEEYCDEIKSIWDSRWLTNAGPKHQLLESELKSFLGTKHVCLFANGHLALEYALESFGFEPGSEVITTPFTFVSTVNAIVRKSLIPVFCDISPEDYTIDVKKIEHLITKKTVAILPVHVYGHLCNFEEIKKIAHKYNLKVIYDGAHAFGERLNGKGVSKYGDITMFSFHATKVFNTIEGGALCFDNDKFKPILDTSRNFGIVSEEECLYFGGNAKMNEFQAAMGLCNLRYVKDNIKKRKKLYELYTKRLSNINGIILPCLKDNISYNYSYIPVRFCNYKFSRDEIKERLNKANIFSRKYFYPAVNEFECFKKRNYPGETPIAKMISEQVLTLPLYPDLDQKTVKIICDIILSN